MSTPMYTLCARCDHFVEPNEIEDIDRYGVAEYVHLDDGEKDHDHDATPNAFTRPLATWRRVRPDLFQLHIDGKIGPNSIHHVHLGLARADLR